MATDTADSGRPKKRKKGRGKGMTRGLRRTRKDVRRLLRRASKKRRALGKRLQAVRRRARRLYNRRYRWTYGRRIDRVPSRDELPSLLNARGLVGEGAEIGVKLGKYSDYLLTFWGGRKLISIDPWAEAAADEYVDTSNVGQELQDANYEQTRARLARHGERSEIWRLTSLEGASRVADASLDFVYIDARHDYASVKEDLAAWYPKVRPGGIIAGHDYVDGHFPQGDFGVKSAVDEFFAARGLPVHSTEGPSAVEMFPSWIVEVPEDGSPASERPRPGT